MILRIAGVEHDLAEVLSRPSLNDLFYLKVKSKSPEYPAGISLVTLGEYLKKLAKIKDPRELVDDPDVLLALKGVVYLCRRHAGERLSWEDAGDLELRDLDFVIEESDELVLAKAQEDPQSAPSDSGAGDAVPLAGP
jgi:hypothetical protein